MRQGTKLIYHCAFGAVLPTAFGHHITLNVTPQEIMEAKLEATALLPAEPQMTTPHINWCQQNIYSTRSALVGVSDQWKYPVWMTIYVQSCVALGRGVPLDPLSQVRVT